MFSGLFFRDGRVMGLSRVFRSLRIPLGDKRGKEGARNREVGIAIWADNGRFPRKFRPRRKMGLARSAERGILSVS